MRQAEIAAHEWQKHNYDTWYLWHVDRLKRLQEILTWLDLDKEQIKDSARFFAAIDKKTFVISEHGASKLFRFGSFNRPMYKKESNDSVRFYPYP